MRENFGKEIPKLGFGLMRLPVLEGTQAIDIEQTKKMVDIFMNAGFTYFDTAFTYGGGASERAAKECLKALRSSADFCAFTASKSTWGRISRGT